MNQSFKQILIASLFALVVIISPASYAQSLDFAQLTVDEDVTPEERLAKKIELTVDALEKAEERVVEMRAQLEALEFEDETPELQLRDNLVTRTNEYSTFYNEKLTALTLALTIEEVDLIIDEIITYRETIYAPGAKEIIEFNLVYSYTPSVLTLADQRMENILKDVARLEGLELIEPSTFVSRTDEAQAILQKAHDLQTQAATLLIENFVTPTATSTLAIEFTEVPLEPEITPRLLAEQSLAEIKSLYELFIETGEKVTETLGIN